MTSLIGFCCKQVSNIENSCKEYLFCKPSLFSILTKDILIESRKQNFLNQIKKFSYITVIVPVLVFCLLTVVIFLKIILILSLILLNTLKYIVFPCIKFPPQVEFPPPTITLTKEQKEKLIEDLKKEKQRIFLRIEEGDLRRPETTIEWLSVKGVFRHRDIPGLIFRTPIKNRICFEGTYKEEIENMQAFANECWRICEKNNLNLLTVPKVGMETLGSIHGRDRYILVMEELDFKPSFEEQFILRKNLLKDSKTLKQLEALEEQIVTFELISKYKDVSHENIPILNKKSEKEPLKAGIIDFDSYEENLYRGLFGTSCDFYVRMDGIFFILETKKARKKVFLKAMKILPLKRNRIKKAYEKVVYLLTLEKKLEIFHKQKKDHSINTIQLDDFKDLCEPRMAFNAARKILEQLNGRLKLRQDSFRVNSDQILIPMDRKGFLSAKSSQVIVRIEGEIRIAALKDIFGEKKLYESYQEVIDRSLLNQVCKILIERKIIVDFKLVPTGISFWL